MDIQAVDKNFAWKDAVVKGNKKVYTMPCAPFDMYGVFYEEESKRFVRLPKSVAEATSVNLTKLFKHTAGGRIRFTTDSNYIGIHVKWENLSAMQHMPLTGSAGFTLMAHTKKGLKLISAFRPHFEDMKGFSASIKVPKKMTSYTLYFPLYNDVISLEIELNAKATVEHGVPYKEELPILYYGSSITQGGCASRPDNSYQGFIEKWNNIDHINLGFSGSAKGEDAMLDYIKSIKSSAYVLDYDHNGNPEILSKTHFKAYETYRKENPTTPIIMVSRPDFKSTTSFKEVSNNRKNLKIIMDNYKKALELGDKNVYFIDGRNFFKGKDEEWCAVDGTHPNDLGFYKMATIIYKKLVQIDKKFK